MSHRLTKYHKDQVSKIVADAMNAPADDEMASIVFRVYKEFVASGEIDRDLNLEREFMNHLSGTKYAEDF